MLNSEFSPWPSFTEEEAAWESAAAWMDRRLVLRNATITELQLRIEQLYGVKIAIAGDFLAQERFSSSFPEGATFVSVIESICQLYNVRYNTIFPGEVTLYRK